MKFNITITHHHPGETDDFNTSCIVNATSIVEAFSKYIVLAVPANHEITFVTIMPDDDVAI